jgi:hypothetical protein
MTTLATTTFLQVVGAIVVVLPIALLWIAAMVDVFRHGHSGLRIAATLVLILIVPILGPILYFVFAGRPAVNVERPPASGASDHMLEAQLHGEGMRPPMGRPGPYT